MEEHEPVGVEVAQIAGGVVAVDGEELLPAAAAYSAQGVGAAQLDLADRAGVQGRPVSTSTIRTSMPSNGLPQLPQADGGMSVSAA